MDSTIATYKPLIVVVLLSFAMASALHIGWEILFMDSFMGVFLCFLAAFKFFDLRGFAARFSAYDPVARRVPAYGIAYPFIEALLGLLYLSAMYPLLTNALMLAVMIAGGTGIFLAVRSGAKLPCACAGSSFNFPVGRVTLCENAAMGMMAAINLVNILG